MTTVDAGSPGTAVVPAATPASGPGPSRPPAPGPRPRPLNPWLAAGAMPGLIALFLVGFFTFLYGLSYLPEAHAQTTMFKNFVNELQQGTAPVAPSTTNPDGSVTLLPAGSPVAVLNIPQLGLKDVVVVDGTTSRELALGPGHVRASALPGQQGVSFIYGKAASYGAPFAHLMRLNRGDQFTVTTGQGTATYVVESFGTSDRPAPADSANRLVLETAAPSFVPGSAVQVSADLVSRPQANPGGWPQISPAEANMGRDTIDALVPLALWSLVLLVAMVVSTVGVYRWSRWRTYLLMAPIVLALNWCVYENLACLLPNLY